MKTFLHLILCLALLGCSANTPPAPPPPNPKPKPPVVQPPTGRYIIMEFDAPGHVKHTWYVTSYKETAFPRTVTFMADGKTITLRGSYEIDQEE